VLQQPTSLPGNNPASGSATTELMLYDPEAHRMQLEVVHADSGVQPVKQDDLQDNMCGATVVDDTATGIVNEAPPGASNAVSGSTAHSGLIASGAGMSGWGQRVKVYADSFLVEKLRPHQREGVRYVGLNQSWQPGHAARTNAQYH